MKKTIATLFAVATLLGTTVPALAASQVAPKITGGVKYVAYDLERQAEFEAADAISNRPVKGNFNYKDANGDWYKVDVQAVKIDGNMGYFAGEVVSASNPAWVGNWLSAAVLDAGSPGSKGDQIYGIFTDETTAKNNVSAMTAPGPTFAVTNGNLTVH